MPKRVARLLSTAALLEMAAALAAPAEVRAADDTGAGSSAPAGAESPTLGSEPVHGTWYVRIGGGIAGLNDAIAADGQPDATLGGLTVAYEVAAGLSPLDGLALGLGLWGGHAPSPAVEIDAAERSGDAASASFGIAGVHADYYFRPAGGFHAQALLGLGFLAGAPDDVRTPWGLGVGIGGGYEWSLGSGLALGLLGRITYAPLGTEAPAGADESHTVTMPALLVTATYY